MSDSSQHESEPSSPVQSSSSAIPIDNHVDADTLRIMVSTDNHLGYMERDPVRGNDSFAAFEEVLLLSKRHHVSTKPFSCLVLSFFFFIQQ
jgi:double-strand break repair protein MRE11